MKGGLVVPHFGINIIKENLTRLSSFPKKKDLNHFGYMIECYISCIISNIRKMSKKLVYLNLNLQSKIRIL